MKKSEWTLKEIIKAMEDNMHYQMTFLAKHTPSLHIVPQPDITVVQSDINDDTFNYVLSAQFSKDNVSKRVADVFNIFNNANLPFSWWVGQNDSPNNLGNFLIEQGLLFKEKNIGMYLQLDIFFPQAASSSLKFQRVKSIPALMDFSNIIVSIGGNPEVFNRIYSKIPPKIYQEESNFQMYVGYLQGEPIVTGILVLHADVGGIYYVATVPTQRKKGYGTAMMEHLLMYAKEHGYHIATLQASTEGKSLYERMGFAACGTFKEYANNRTE